MAGLGSNCLLRPERWPQMWVAAESLAIYTAAVVGSSPAGPTSITAGQRPIRAFRSSVAEGPQDLCANSPQKRPQLLGR